MVAEDTAATPRAVELATGRPWGCSDAVTHRRAGSTSALTVGDRDLDTHRSDFAVCRIFFARSAIKTRSRLSARCASPLTASSVTSESNRRERATTQRSFEVERVARMIGAPPTNDRHHDELDRRNR